MSTVFEPSIYEEMVFEQSNETKTTPIPEGQYRGLIDKIELRQMTIKNGPNAGQTRLILGVSWEVLEIDEELLAELGRDRVIVRQDIWLDIDDHGSIAFGPNRNVGLGRLREAVGLNTPGKPFTFKTLEGAGPALITIGERPVESGDVYNEVKKVSSFED